MLFYHKGKLSIRFPLGWLSFNSLWSRSLNNFLHILAGIFGRIILNADQDFKLAAVLIISDIILSKMRGLDSLT